MKRFWVMLIFVAMSLTASAGSSTTEGDGMIYCIADVVGVLQMGCEGDLAHPTRPRGADQPMLETGEVDRVTLTISWDPQVPEARELSVFVHGNPACYTAPELSSCMTDRAWGLSPLVLTLEGAAASNYALIASIQLRGSCMFETTGEPYYVVVPTGCDVPPVKVVRDQPFHYEWVIE